MLLRKECESQGLGLVLYSLRSTPEQLPRDWCTLPEMSVNTEPDQALPALAEAMRTSGKPGVLVIDFADLTVSSAASLDGPVAPVVKAIQQLATDPAWRQGGLSMVLIDRGGGILGRVSSISGMHHITITSPDWDELRTFIERRQTSTRVTRLVLDDALAADRAATLAAADCSWKTSTS